MNKKEVKEFFRGIFPDIRWLRKYVTKKRIKRFTLRLLSPEDIKRGEENAAMKQDLVEEYLPKWPEYISPTEEQITDVLHRAPEFKNRTDKDDLRIDMLFCRFAYGFRPDEYLCFGLENKSAEERQEYVSDVERLCYAYQMNDPFEVPIFNNKARTYQLYREYYNREAISIKKPGDFAEFQRYIKKHPVFVKKAVFESMGRSVELIDTATCGKTEQELFNEWISEGLHILEERVVQSDITAALNASSVNTIRCITLNTRESVIVPYCFMKVGRKGSFVDNGGAGGILVGIDKDTGVLNSDGYDELNIQYEKHPDTGVTFKGFQLPEWETMLSICKEMSAKMDKVKYIGWDMAYTNHGWVVIEGNGISQMIGPQIVWKRGIKKEVSQFMLDMDLLI